MFRRLNLSIFFGVVMFGELVGNLVFVEEVIEVDLIIWCSMCRDFVVIYGRVYLFERCGCVSWFLLFNYVCSIYYE